MFFQGLLPLSLRAIDSVKVVHRSGFIYIKRAQTKSTTEMRKENTDRILLYFYFNAYLSHKDTSTAPSCLILASPKISVAKI